MLPNRIPYYKDTSKIRKLDCPLLEFLSVKAANVIYQFGDILRSVELPEKWREVIEARCSQRIEEGEDTKCIKRRRAELEAEQKRLVRCSRRAMGTSRETMHRLAQQESIELQTSQKLTLEQREEAFLMLDGGMSLRQIAKHFGVS